MVEIDEEKKVEFANDAKTATLVSGISEEELKEDRENDMLLNTPYIPDDVFNALPNLLKESCAVFQNRRRRDVYFTGAIAILSGCVPNISGIYDGRRVWANLYAFIIAPPSSDKQAVIYAKILADNYNSSLLKESVDAQRNYRRQLDRFNQTVQRGETGNQRNDQPEEPPFRMHYIPGDNSSSGIKKILQDNDGRGTIVETEADTIANSLKRDWGGWSDMLRKAFHNESISSYRSTNREHINISSPRLSVAITGTPSQILGIINSSEDGLFSRFIFYLFKNEPKWRDVIGGHDGKDLGLQFYYISQRVNELIEYYSSEKEFEFILTTSQGEDLNRFGDDTLKHIVTFVNYDLSSTVFRMGLIIYRIAMLLTAIRNFEQNGKDKKLPCTDQDFNIALTLANIYLNHSVGIYKRLPKASKVENTSIRLLYENLPLKFERKDALKIGGEVVKKCNRSIEYYLEKLVKIGLINKTGHGTYEKVSEK